MPLTPDSITRELFGSWYDCDNKVASFRIYSKNASRIELQIFSSAKNSDPCLSIVMVQSKPAVWTADFKIAKIKSATCTDVVYYGYRAWGPNWTYDINWKPGSLAGFISDCDNGGNRFNPNKLLIDPWTREVSHDPQQRLSTIDPNECISNYYSGDGNREFDTASIGPKSMLLLNEITAGTGIKPKRPLRDDIIYEVNLRGFTVLDRSIPQNLRGTFKGAATKASYLRDLGVTAVEFLPVQHFANEQNDDNDSRGDNYWGYMTLGYFAPNRRYSSDKSPGGPTREFKEMVRSFHEAGIKVFLDIVFNHTGEGLLYRSTEDNDSRDDDFRQDPDRACILSFRGLDNASFYSLRTSYVDNGRTSCRYLDNSACGGNLNVTNESVKDFICDVIRYWTDQMGVDGFRFDLAAVLGNKNSQESFEFDCTDPDNMLIRIVKEAPLRSNVTFDGVDLIAEPWAMGKGQTYQLGKFPDGWSEWNDNYRTTVRQFENKLHVMPLHPKRIANALAGSDQPFWYGSTRKEPCPSNSINYVASHDGCCLRDLFCFTAGEFAWDHYQNSNEQRKAVRNIIALLLVSAGVPMFCGGDELYKTMQCLQNAVAIDSTITHLDWSIINDYLSRGKSTDGLVLSESVLIYNFFKGMITFRQKNQCMRPENYYTGLDLSGKGIKDISWLRSDGQEFTGNDWETGTFIGMRIDNQYYRSSGDTGSVYVAYNWNDQHVDIKLPRNIDGMQWFRYSDTASWMEFSCNIDEHFTPLDSNYGMHGRSVIVLFERFI